MGLHKMRTLLFFLPFCCGAQRRSTLAYGTIACRHKTTAFYSSLLHTTTFCSVVVVLVVVFIVFDVVVHFQPCVSRLARTPSLSCYAQYASCVLAAPPLLRWFCARAVSMKRMLNLRTGFLQSDMRVRRRSIELTLWAAPAVAAARARCANGLAHVLGLHTHSQSWRCSRRSHVRLHCTAALHISNT